jgi:quercetin dioxygenase-like cupin family protein
LNRPLPIGRESYGQAPTVWDVLAIDPGRSGSHDRWVEVWDLGQEPVEARAPRVLRSDDDANRIVLLSLPAGEQLQDHQVHEHALVLVLSGRLHVLAGDEEHELGPSGMVHFEPAERHEVSAIDDCRLVLFLAPWPGVGHPSRP